MGYALDRSAQWTTITFADVIAVVIAYVRASAHAVARAIANAIVIVIACVNARPGSTTRPGVSILPYLARQASGGRPDQTGKRACERIWSLGWVSVMTTRLSSIAAWLRVTASRFLLISDLIMARRDSASWLTFANSQLEVIDALHCAAISCER
jgi:hypothetical protein